jgi:hypothetical protein
VERSKNEVKKRRRIEGREGEKGKGRFKKDVERNEKKRMGKEPEEGWEEENEEWGIKKWRRQEGGKVWRERRGRECSWSLKVEYSILLRISLRWRD